MKLVEVFREVKRVLKDDGTLWLNLGDSYCGSRGNGDVAQTRVNLTAEHFVPFANVTAKIQRLKPKDLVGIPWRVAFALQADGWYLRSDIIWAKPNPMPESVTDRPTKSHEYLFLLSKSERYYYDAAAIAEPCDTPLDSTARQSFGSINGKLNNGIKAHSNNHGAFQEKRETRNKRTVWTVATQPYSEAHFSTFPPKLIEPCILAGCPSGGLVLDPFAGSGTTIQVAQQLGRQGVGIELNPAYIALADTRTAQTGLPL
jgi:DNA modification methylase